MRQQVLRLLAAAVLAAGFPASVAGQAASATFTYPSDGAVAVDVTRPVAWTSVANAQAYYLWVGSTPGTNDLVNTGEIQQTSYLAASLPPGRTVYAAIWTKIDGVWWSSRISFTTAVLTATFVYPLDGGLDVDLITRAFEWTAVSNVQAYYLWVGTAPNTNNVVNTGEIQQTSYLAANLPEGQTLYANIWAKVGGIWRATAVTFTTSTFSASWMYPADGATNVDLSRLMSWTSLPSAQAYYLWVGTSPGEKDVVNTGEIQQTSYHAANLPPSQRLYATIWTKYASRWRSRAISFTTPPVVATWVYPANGDASVDLSRPLEWTSVPYVQAYYLWVGSTPGANDLVNTGEIQQISYLASTLPAGRTVYASIWTKVGGRWRSSAITFTTAVLTASWIYPTDGAADVDVTRLFEWSSVLRVQAYYLWIGTAPGAQDLVNTGEIQQTSYLARTLPPGRTLYASIWTKVGGVWRSSNAAFTTRPGVAARFVYPPHGASGVDPSRPFEWTGAVEPDGYLLYIGTAPGQNDLLDTGEILQTTYLAPALPADRTLYARIWTRKLGTWRLSDAAFTLAASVDPARISFPPDGATNVDTARPFEWPVIPLARGYELEIGSAPGLNDLHDSGPIRVTRRFVPNLPAGVPLFGRLYTNINGQWLASSFSFAAGSTLESVPIKIDSALWATGQVRGMADTYERPYRWTELWDRIPDAYRATAADYTAVLQSTLGQMNVGLPVRPLEVAFNGRADSHTLVEMQNTGDERWMLLDPKFSLSVKRAADQAWASADDVSDATVAQSWGALSFTFLGGADATAARGYYLDYPLLYLNLHRAGNPIVPGLGRTPLPYLEEVALPAAGPKREYLVRCDGTSEIRALVNGTMVTIACLGVDRLSATFYARTISLAEGGGSFRLYRPRRFVF